MAATSNTETSIPLRLREVSCEGATCLRFAANDCRARDEGANCMVDGARADDGVTGTMAQFADWTVLEGAQGAIAMWRGSPCSWAVLGAWG